MIPVLFEGNAQSFLNNGLGRLADTISCKVTEERNGMFELEMVYPITGIHYSEIHENRIIVAKTEDGGSKQAFVIYKITKPLNGAVTIYAEHISYLLSGFVVMPYHATSCADALQKIPANTVVNTPFSYHTDVANSNAFDLDLPRSVRSLLGGQQGSLLDVYGGNEYKFDNFDVWLYAHRGHDNGVTIRYAKNLTALKNVDDMTNVYTGIVPFWSDSEGNTMYLTNRVVYSDHAEDYPYKIIKAVDFSSEFQSEPTEAQLLARAQSYIENNSGWKPKNTIDVSFVNLTQTEEYKDLAVLERVKLCDYVTVIYEKLGVNVKTKVVKTVYNVLMERYDSITLGDTGYTLTKAVQEVLDTPTEAEVTSNLQKAIEHATKLIQGGLGGHVIFNTNADGEPEEILIMDTDSTQTAAKVIRMNQNGIGFSRNGYNGPFNTAWTIDGAFNASFITAGTMDADLIRAGTITDLLGNNYWNLDTGEFKLTSSALIGNRTIQSILEGIDEQIDDKAETWYQSADPALSWTTADDKEKHKGDLWYNTTNGTTWYYKKTDNAGVITYAWEQQNIPQSVFDKIDGKAQIFITPTNNPNFTPTPPYAVGDLWFKGTDDTTGGLVTCITAKTATQQYAAADWEKKDNYVDSDDVESAITTYDTQLDQEAVFDKLTDNGSILGIYMSNNQLYINATYIAAGIIEDAAHKFSLNMATGALSMADGTFTGTITGSIIQSAASGNRVLLDTTSSISGKEDDDLVNIINMAKPFQNIEIVIIDDTNEEIEIQTQRDLDDLINSGVDYTVEPEPSYGDNPDSQLIIDAMNRIDIRTPEIWVANTSGGTGAVTVTKTKTTDLTVVTDVWKDTRHAVELGLNSDGGEECDVYCTLPVFLSQNKVTISTINGFVTAKGNTTTSHIT